MKPAPFEYHAPADAKEAVQLLAELGDGAKLIAGGQSLVPLLALRLASFEHLIDLRKVSGLRGIENRAGSLPDAVGSDGADPTAAGSARPCGLARARPRPRSAGRRWRRRRSRCWPAPPR